MDFIPKIFNQTQFGARYATDAEGRVIPEHDMPRFRAARGERLNGFEMTWHTPEETDPLLVFSDVLPAMYGHPESVIIVFQDIRKLKDTEIKLKKATEIALAASRAKTRFLANMSHEIRTPLAAILGYADFLSEPKISAPDRQAYVKTIRRNGELLLRIINDVLDLSKIEAETFDVEENSFVLVNFSMT